MPTRESSGREASPQFQENARSSSHQDRATARYLPVGQVRTLERQVGRAAAVRGRPGLVPVWGSDTLTSSTRRRSYSAARASGPGRFRGYFAHALTNPTAFRGVSGVTLSSTRSSNG
jgi:hypothetical protein